MYFWHITLYIMYHAFTFIHTIFPNINKLFLSVTSFLFASDFNTELVFSWVMTMCGFPLIHKPNQKFYTRDEKSYLDIKIYKPILWIFHLFMHYCYKCSCFHVLLLQIDSYFYARRSLNIVFISFHRKKLIVKLSKK